MYRVTFENNRRIERTIGHAETEDEAFKIIDDFLDEHNYKSYYKRISYIEEKCAKWIDVGSWAEFFYIYKEG